MTTWISQRVQARTAQLSQEVPRRQDLYRDFITAASKAYGDALVSSEPALADLVPLYSMISRMRVLSESRTVVCADKIMRTIIDTYLAPSHSVRKLTDLIKSGADIDLLREFSEAARDEVRVYTAL